MRIICIRLVTWSVTRPTKYTISNELGTVLGHTIHFRRCKNVSFFDPVNRFLGVSINSRLVPKLGSRTVEVSYLQVGDMVTTYTKSSRLGVRWLTSRVLGELSVGHTQRNLKRH